MKNGCLLIWPQLLKTRAMLMSNRQFCCTLHSLHAFNWSLCDGWAWSRFVQSQDGPLHFERKGNMTQQGQYGKGSFMARCCSSFHPTCLLQNRCFINIHIELSTRTPSCPSLGYLWSSALEPWEWECPGVLLWGKSSYLSKHQFCYLKYGAHHTFFSELNTKLIDVDVHLQSLMGESISPGHKQNLTTSSYFISVQSITFYLLLLVTNLPGFQWCQNIAGLPQLRPCQLFPL